MQVFLRHREGSVDAIETHLAVGTLEGEWVIDRHLESVVTDPFVHTPKRATSGSCSVGPIGPQIPTGLSAVARRQAPMYSSASAR